MTDEAFNRRQVHQLEAEIERLHKIELQFLALQEERVRWFADNEWLTTDNEQLREALQDIAEDPYAVDGGAADIARRALEPKP